jgi:hypothetical protein
MRTEPAGIGGSLAAPAGNATKDSMTRNRKLSAGFIWPLQASILDVMVALSLTIKLWRMGNDTTQPI